jgi:hypothetical protein
MTYEQIQAIAPDGLLTLENTVRNGLRHEDYNRTVERAELYYKLITGDGINSLLRQFVRRETPEMFEQRERLTQAITPAVSSSLMSPFYKVPRANNITVKIDFESTEQYEEKKQRIEEALKTYNGDASLDSYMEGRFVELSWMDPNAFIVTEFEYKKIVRDDFGNPEEYPKPYPWEVSSAEAINYKYENNTLKWLVIRCGEKELRQARHIIYLPVYAISFDPVNPDLYPSVEVGKWADVYINGEVVSVIRVKEKEMYVIRMFEHKCGFVPAKRVGYKRDLTTKGRTCVSPIEPALPYFMKSIKTVSEFDLTMALSAHPQKLAYETPCPVIGCSSGTMPTGETCSGCGGTGKSSLSSSAQDAVTIPLPRKREDAVPLDNLVKYVSPEVALLEFQDTYIKELKNEAKQAVYNSEIFSKTEVAATATEKAISMESVYDTLLPFSGKYSEMWAFQVRVAAQYIDIVDIFVLHKFPKDFQFRTRDELLFQQKSAAESSAPSYVKKALSRELAGELFIDSPDELKRIMIKEMFHPFSDKTADEIAYIVSSTLTPESTKVLWANFDQIFDELEQEVEEQEGKYLYDLATAKIREKVKAKVQAIIDEVTPDEAVMFGIDGEAGAPGAAAVADSALNGAQITGMVDIVEKAASKGIPIEGAAELLKLAFPTVDPASIDKVIATLRNFKPAAQPDSFNRFQ